MKVLLIGAALWAIGNTAFAQDCSDPRNAKLGVCQPPLTQDLNDPATQREQKDVEDLLRCGDLGRPDEPYEPPPKAWWMQDGLSSAVFQTYFRTAAGITAWCQAVDCRQQVLGFCKQYRQVDEFVQFSIQLPGTPVKMSVNPLGFCKLFTGSLPGPKAAAVPSREPFPSIRNDPLCSK